MLIAEVPVSFITPLSDVHVYEKDEARFELEVSREPATFHWFKGTQELENDDKFEIIQEGKRHTLVVRSARYSDEARYSFEAEDKRTSGKLIIEGRLSRCFRKYAVQLGMRNTVGLKLRIID